MQEGRFSTIRFNEWICVTAQYEKAVARLGRQVYQGYSRGILVDFTSLEICKQISDTFAEAREMREELEEELERDALDGLSVEETKVADEHRTLSQAQKTKRTFKLKLTKFMGRAAINRKLAAHRNMVKDLSRDLGMRALACYKDNPLLKVKGHKALCRLAEQLSDDADQKWQEIVKINKEQGGGLSFHTILINFIGSFANFGKNTPLGRAVLKYFKYDEAAENKKLKEAYQGSATAETLKAQLEEIEEPHLDLGREMDNMQQEYEETPVEWNMPSVGKEPESGKAAESYAAYPAPAEPAAEKWEPEADTWDPGSSSDDDFLDAVSEVPSFEAAEEPPAPTAGPTLLRRRPEPEAESWAEAPSLPSIHKENVSSSSAAAAQESAGEEWDWSNTESADNWDEPTPSNFAPKVAETDPFADQTPAHEDPFAFDEPGGDPFAPPSAAPPAAPTAPASPPPQARPAAQREPSSKPPEDNWAAPQAPPQQTPPAPSSNWAQPAASANPGWAQEPSGASRPPFVKAQQKEKPLGDWTPEPAAPKSNSNWGGDSIDEEYGWSVPTAAASAPPTPAPPAPPSTPSAPPFAQPKPEAPPFVPPAAQVPPATSAPSTPPPPVPVSKDGEADLDPLLRLLRADDQTAAPEPPAPTEDSLDDDLLPDFLKNRDDDEGAADDAFIPELPSFLAADEGPQLEILPFGSQDDFPAVKPKDGPGEEPFIPEMPDL